MTEVFKFPPEGLTYFWFLNDYCENNIIDEQIASFCKAKIRTVCLHPRDGLLLPYGSSDWFEFIRNTAKKLAENNIEVWLYDEDPYPSGNAGGRIILDHPEFIAHKITMYQANREQITQDGLWYFPAKGKLIFCAFFEEKNDTLLSDMTNHVGLVRRNWEILKNWDSRWYYPATPLYTSDRAMANIPEYAIKVKKLPENQILASFTIEPIKCNKWNFYVDPLNPAATEKFIEYTHERYKDVLGDMLGKTITSIFTDEAKYYGETPWTPGIFERFQEQYGYDLKSRLYDLFNANETPENVRTRLNYREWCGRQFEEAWLKPVAEWCRKHSLNLIGHLSPEDDIVSQSKTISNLMPLQKHLSLAGFDLIVPAVGDPKHPLLNIGILSAVSSAQQHKLSGVMGESLACSGADFTIEKARKILNWQTVMGMTTPVIHGSFHSLRGERALECPPDLGPSSPFRDSFMQLADDLRPVQKILFGAVQIAPVAILWPIKSFHANKEFWQPAETGLRKELTDLILACLESHIGIQFLDEADFHSAEIDNGMLKIGNSSYSHVIVPGSTVWHKRTWDLLEKYMRRQLNIYQYGTSPKYLETSTAIIKIGEPDLKNLTTKTIRNDLPKLMNFKSSDSSNIRISAWSKKGKLFHLVCYLGDGSIDFETVNCSCKLSSQTVTTIESN